MSGEDVFRALSDAVVDMDEAAARALSERAVAEGVDALAAIEKGLVEGMNRAGALFEEEEYFVPELLLCSDAMYAGLEVLRPHLRRDEGKGRRVVVIGVVQGDTHDIGKNLVKIMLDAAGFEVVDLGRDIPPQRFVDEAASRGADVVALSTLMTTTMDGMAQVVKLLGAAGLRDRVKVVAGGGPVSQSFVQRIGADGYAPTAPTAVQLVRQLLGGAA